MSRREVLSFTFLCHLEKKRERERRERRNEELTFGNEFPQFYVGDTKIYPIYVQVRGGSFSSCFYIYLLI